MLSVGGLDHPINSDFRFAVRIILAFEDDDLTPQEKNMVLLSNIFPVMPLDYPEALEEGMWFLDGGDRTSGETDEETPKLYSFLNDSNLIFSAFYQTHKLDLQAADIHWWKFLALFTDLGADTAFCTLISLRKRVKSGQATEDEKRVAREMGEMFLVPEVDTRTLAEKIHHRNFMEAVQGDKS